MQKLNKFKLVKCKMVFQLGILVDAPRQTLVRAIMGTVLEAFLIIQVLYAEKLLSLIC